MVGRGAEGPLEEGRLWVDQFLEAYMIELERSIEPHKLQLWADEVLSGMQEGEERRPVPTGALPEMARTAPLQRSLIIVTAINKGSKTNSCVLFLYGSGRGFYGVQVGSREFVPPDDGRRRRQWVPGVYVYFIPPI